MKRYKIRGINDDESFCECCGRTNLKAVVWIEDAETGEVKHFGRVCASAPSKAFGILKEDFAAAERQWKRAVASRIARARRAYKAAGGQYVTGDQPWKFKPADPELWENCYEQAGEVLVQW